MAASTSAQIPYYPSQPLRRRRKRNSNTSAEPRRYPTRTHQPHLLIPRHAIHHHKHQYPHTIALLADPEVLVLEQLEAGGGERDWLGAWELVFPQTAELGDPRGEVVGRRRVGEGAGDVGDGSVGHRRWSGLDGGYEQREEGAVPVLTGTMKGPPEGGRGRWVNRLRPRDLEERISEFALAGELVPAVEWRCPDVRS